MTDVIEFLEKMGSDAQFHQGSRDQVALALMETGIAPEVQLALIAKDQSRLEQLLGQVPLCAVFLPGKQEEEEEGEGDDDETPSREPHESPEHSRVRDVVVATA